MPGLGFPARVALRSEAEALAERLLIKLGLSAPFSLQDLCQAVAREYGTSLLTYHAGMPSDFGGLGLADRDGHTIILVNRCRSHLAEDHTILHELGHLVMGHLVPEHVPHERDEVQADYFARTMLGRMLLPKTRPPSAVARLKRFLGG